MTYQGVGLSIPFHYPCFTGIIFSSLSFFSILHISSFTISSFIICFVLCFHRLAAIYPVLSILHISGHSALSSAWDIVDAQQILLLVLLFLFSVKGFLWFLRPGCG